MNLKLLLAVALITAGQTNFLRAEEIQVSDLGTKVTLVGKLGKPLGTMATVEGQLISEPKQAKTGRFTAAIRVNEVDGKALEAGQVVGLIFYASAGVPSAHANEIIRFTGYEGGAFIGTPAAVRSQLGQDASPLDWKFESTVYVIKLEVPEANKP